MFWLVFTEEITVLYRIIRKHNELYFECRDKTLGSQKPRHVKGSNKVAPLFLLEMLVGRGHLVYKIFYEGVALTQRDWEKTLEEEDFSEDLLDIQITSHLNVITLCGFATNVLLYPRSTKPAHTKKSQYSKPTSKKKVQSSWLYQNGEESVEGKVVGALQTADC